MKPVGSKVAPETYQQLRWLAYKRTTTVSNLIATYIEEGLKGEDLSGYAEARKLVERGGKLCPGTTRKTRG